MPPIRVPCAEDCSAFREQGADIVFAPDQEEMYRQGGAQGCEVLVPDLEALYCGHFRPGHFRGVATVVSKLFHIVWPSHAVFGEKDYQQLVLIRRLTAELDFPIVIEGVPTVRESDGLAMSSRNRYLSPAERRQAPLLHATLRELGDAVRRGEEDLAAAQAQGMERLREAGFRPEYLAVADAQSLGPVERGRECVVLAAAWLGRARLIDNCLPWRVQSRRAEG